MGRSLKGQISYASRLNARRVVIVNRTMGVVRERDGRPDWDVSLLDADAFIQQVLA
jgi:hypothetical protein